MKKSKFEEVSFFQILVQAAV